jgi:signal transduction histidine kinase
VTLLIVAVGMSQLPQLTVNVRQTFILITIATCVFTLLALYRLEYEERSNWLYGLKMEWQRLAVDTQRREAERQKERVEQAHQQLSEAEKQLIHQETMASLGRLVAGVAHEISTPLGNIRMSASFMREHLDSFAADLKGGRIGRSGVTEWLRDMQHAADVLDIASERANQQIIGFKQLAVDQSSGLSCRFELAHTVEVVIKSMSHYLRKSEITVSTSIDAELALHGEPGRLEQVIVNLITNAVVHAYDEHGPGTISIHARRTGDQIELRFTDNGKGMPPAVQSKIFEPFFTTRFGRGGSGLGLYIVHNIVTHGFGGRLRVESELESGTTFILMLPAAP